MLGSRSNSHSRLKCLLQCSELRICGIQVMTQLLFIAFVNLLKCSYGVEFQQPCLNPERPSHEMGGKELLQNTSRRNGGQHHEDKT